MVTANGFISTQSKISADTGFHNVHNKNNTNTGLPVNPPDTFKEYILNPGESIIKKISDNIFVKAHSEKISCYVGEPIVITYKLYSRLPATSVITKQPSLGGFSVYDITDFIPLSGSVETINNKVYKVHVLRKSQLLPLQAGDLELDALELNNTIHFVKFNEGDAPDGKSLKDLLDHLALEESAPKIERQAKIISSPLTIKVKSFPEANRPANFNGAIGSFIIKATVATENIIAKDAAILKVEILGKGNLPLIDAPNIDWPAGIDTLDIKQADDFDKSVAPFQGKKIFEFKFSPGRAGAYIIPAVSFSYFDPASKSYKTVFSKSNAIKVSQGKASTINSDNRHSISSQSKNLSAIITFVKQNALWIVIISLLTSFCILLWKRNISLKKKEKVIMAEAAIQNRTEIMEIPSDILSECRKKLAADDMKSFYECIGNEIWKLLDVKLKLNPSELNKTTVTMALHQRGWADELTTILDDILTKSDRSKYLPDYRQDSDSSLIMEQIETVITRLKDL